MINLIFWNLSIFMILIKVLFIGKYCPAKLSKLFSKCKVTVETKADSLYSIVGAASICAKVIRDNVVKNWKFPELIDAPEQNDFGTGYPNDPKSKQFLTENTDDVFGFPNLVRFSWSTAEKFLENCVKVDWEDENEVHGSNQKSISSFFIPLSSSRKVKHESKCSFLKERSLNSADKF